MESPFGIHSDHTKTKLDHIGTKEKEPDFCPVDFKLLNALITSIYNVLHPARRLNITTTIDISNHSELTILELPCGFWKNDTMTSIH